MRFSDAIAKCLLFYLSSKISFYVNIFYLSSKISFYLDIFLVVWSIEAFGSFWALFSFVFLLHLSSFEMRERRQTSKYLSWIDQRGQNRKLWQRREVRAFQRIVGILLWNSNCSKKTIQIANILLKIYHKYAPKNVLRGKYFFYKENVFSMCGTEINFIPFTQKFLSL